MNTFTRGSLSFAVKQQPPFREWIAGRYGSWAGFLSLKTHDKEKLFLRWKWWADDEKSNEAAEHTRQYILILYRDRDLSALEAGARFMLENMITFERECYKIKKEIGLIEERNLQQKRIDEMVDGI